MTIKDVLQRHPWLKKLPPAKPLEARCPRCRVGLDEPHEDRCELAECTVCGEVHVENECEGLQTLQALWIGVVDPHLTRVAMEHGLYCRCMVQGPDGRWVGCSPEEAKQSGLHGWPVRPWKRCKATEEWAIPDVDGARRFVELSRRN